MYEMLASTLAEDRRQTLIADAVIARRARRTRRFGRRVRHGAPVPQSVSRRFPVRAAFQGWLATGQL
jgi:hypothetical protein